MEISRVTFEHLPCSRKFSMTAENIFIGFNTPIDKTKT